MSKFGLLGVSSIVAICLSLPASAARPDDQMAENLDRGVVVVPAKGGGNLISWRMLPEDGKNPRYFVYRDGQRLTQPPTQNTNLVDPTGTAGARYRVERPGSKADRAGTEAAVWTDGYLSIPLDQPAGGTTPDGVAYSYRAVDGSVGDLDGDGKLEIVLKWDPSNSKDNSQSGYTGNVYIDAYRLDGQRLWRLDLGRNIRAGAHYTQFLVYDFDNDGKAEVALKTGDGTVDGQGRIIGDSAADHRNASGYVLAGPEYLTVFDGPTGRALSTVPYAPGRHPETTDPTSAQLNAIWGDGYGNRVDRFLATPAYLDGKHASIVMARGYYTRSTLAAWDFVNKKLQPRWLFDSAAQPVPADWMGQGNHNLSVGDVDEDGRDEIIYGSMAIDDDGRGLWTAKSAGRNLGHGDALHVGDLDPDRPGLERFGVHESTGSNGGIAASMLDARTGAILWTASGSGDNGRGVAADIDPRRPGAENWSSRQSGLTDAKGVNLAPTRPGPMNFLVYWDGDRQRELLDNITISKWQSESGSIETLLTAEGAVSGNGTKATPILSGDILGDWREEVILAAADHKSMRIYATPYPTQYRYRTLLADRMYRLALAWQNVAYNQPPHLSFDLATTQPD